MNALILNGALAAGGDLDLIQATLTSDLHARGHGVKAYILREVPIAYCLGCFDCWVKTPGICRTNDAGRDVAGAFIGSDVVILLTPVTFGGYSSELKKALDRIIGLVLPFFQQVDGEVHHKRRYAHYPALAVVGLMPEPDADEEAVFKSLVRRNALNMQAPWFASLVYSSSQSADLVNLMGPLLARIESAA